MGIRKLLSLLGVLASLTLGHVSAQEYDWIVTMGENGLPSEVFYRDAEITLTMKPHEFRPIEGGGLEVVYLTIEVLVDEELHSETGTSTEVGITIFGQGMVGQNLELVDPKRLIITGVRLPSLPGNHRQDFLNCSELTVTHWTRPARTQNRRQSSKILWEKQTHVDKMELAATIDAWSDLSPEFVPEGERLKSQSAMVMLEAEDLSAEDAAMDGTWYRPAGCKKVLNARRIANNASLDRLDKKDVEKEITFDQEALLLLINQRLMLCRFEPECEKKFLTETAGCESQNHGRYTESCIRSIEIQR